ncbi:uncharacterized protein L969DRAFT_49370 [Mixia osmundae IAM 14324]|uniref:J domain-containing protein n=1 Tax=Mixia osmundae (strain CBS 9802 / IAM 14324 / JCM 22182 / KY 12970) TaxID=764103 RepID=G7E4B0_MIXOS|nr:uncharacterized protein L969DRAFT_49370 [Mixia osmundae IAM 14324]KEI39767.1 hypothetical protein L969DRAFT_49370 [Mixia osmundae IAM 14324]GAA97670.1 hypothetical protein E5Q_04348 [Mixia osmundae IAM 14324]
MEHNRDEAQRSLAVAERHLANGKYDAALRFIKKSQALYPLPSADALEKLVQTSMAAGSGAAGMNGHAQSEGASASTSSAETHPSGQGLKHRAAQSASPSSATAKGKAKEEQREYTAEQAALVKRVRMCKPAAYYDILALDKACTDTDIKKAYRRLALGLHPDKNGCPGADEAFKSVGKAFQILSDKDKRRMFDQCGADPDDRSSRAAAASAGTRFAGARSANGFGDEINAEDLFNMFFGGAQSGFGGTGVRFGGGSPMFFGPGMQTFSTGGMPRRAQRAGGQQQQEEHVPTPAWLQLLPLILLGLFSLLTQLPSLFTTQPPPNPSYAFEPSSYHTACLETTRSHYTYCVNPTQFAVHPIYSAILEQNPDLLPFNMPEQTDGTALPVSHRNEMLQKQLISTLPILTRSMSSSAKGAEKLRVPSNLRRFEETIEENYIHMLQVRCQREMEDRTERIQREKGLFGIGADWAKIRKMQQERSLHCQKLRAAGYNVVYTIHVGRMLTSTRTHNASRLTSLVGSVVSLLSPVDKHIDSIPTHRKTPASAPDCHRTLPHPPPRILCRPQDRAERLVDMICTESPKTTRLQLSIPRTRQHDLKLISEDRPGSEDLSPTPTLVTHAKGPIRRDDAFTPGSRTPTQPSLAAAACDPPELAGPPIEPSSDAQSLPVLPALSPIDFTATSMASLFKRADIVQATPTERLGKPLEVSPFFGGSINHRAVQGIDESETKAVPHPLTADALTLLDSQSASAKGEKGEDLIPHAISPSSIDVGFPAAVSLKSEKKSLSAAAAPFVPKPATLATSISASSLSDYITFDSCARSKYSSHTEAKLAPLDELQDIVAQLPVTKNLATRKTTGSMRSTSHLRTAALDITSRMAAVETFRETTTTPKRAQHQSKLVALPIFAPDQQTLLTSLAASLTGGQSLQSPYASPVPVAVMSVNKASDVTRSSLGELSVSSNVESAVPPSPGLSEILDQSCSICDESSILITPASLAIKREEKHYTSPDKLIPSLVGPGNLPYARCPSGIDALILPDVKVYPEYQGGGLHFALGRARYKASIVQKSIHAREVKRDQTQQRGYAQRLADGLQLAFAGPDGDAVNTAKSFPSPPPPPNSVVSATGEDQDDVWQAKIEALRKQQNVAAIQLYEQQQKIIAYNFVLLQSMLKPGMAAVVPSDSTADISGQRVRFEVPTEHEDNKENSRSSAGGPNHVASMSKPCSMDFKIAQAFTIYRDPAVSKVGGARADACNSAKSDTTLRAMRQRNLNSTETRSSRAHSWRRKEPAQSGATIDAGILDAGKNAGKSGSKMGRSGSDSHTASASLPRKPLQTIQKPGQAAVTRSTVRRASSTLR